MRPPVAMPLEETIMLGYRESLIFFESSCVWSKWKFGQVNGEPYLAISDFVSGENSSACFRKISTALIAIGLSACTGTVGYLPTLHQLLEHEQEFLRALDGK